MRMELEEKLVKDFPELFKGKDKSLKQSLMAFGCECDDGWYPVIRSMCHAIHQQLKHNEMEFEFTQVKEKYGGLRVYHFGGDAFIDGVIAMAEEMAYKTCELCGSTGTLCNTGYWLKTLCENHAKEHNYEPCKEE